jgi:hypothetical protein
MRLTVKVFLVAVGVALLVAGRPSPQGPAATYGGRDVTGVGFALTSEQPSDRDQPGTDDDTPVTGSAAEQAKAAAEAAAPGATVREVERETNDDDDTSRSAFEVELVRPNGTTIEVELDADYKVITTDQENDSRDDN